MTSFKDQNNNSPLNNNDSSIKNWLTFSRITSIVLLLFVVTLLVSPNAKALLIRGLMKIGLFQPDLPAGSTAVSTTPSTHAAEATGTAHNSGSNENSTTKNPAEPTQDQTAGVLFADGKGETIKLSSLKGKVVFMNFWATWCPPCVAEMPSIDKLYAKYKDNKNVVFLLVDMDGKYKESSDFMKKKGYSLPVFIPASDLPKAYFSGSLPTTVILDKSGKIAFQHIGGADYSNPEVAEFIDKLSK